MTQSLHHILDSLLEALGEEKRSAHVLEAMPYASMRLDETDILNVISRLGYRVKKTQGSCAKLKEKKPPYLFKKLNGELEVITTTQDINEDGILYYFYRKHHQKDGEDRDLNSQANINWFGRILFRFKPLVWRVITKSFILNLVALAVPFFILILYDNIAKSASLSTLITLGIGGILALLIEIYLRFMRSQDIAWVAARSTHLASTGVISHLLSLPSFAIERASAPAQLARIRSFESAQDFLTGGLFLTLLDLPFTFISLLALFFITGSFGLVPLIVIGLIVLVVMLMRPRLKLAMLKAAKRKGEMQDLGNEIMDKGQSIRQSGLCEEMLTRFNTISLKSSKATFVVSIKSQIIEIISYIISMIGAVFLIYGSVENTLAHNMTSGAIFASLILYWRTTAPWMCLFANISRLEQIKKSFSQLDKLLHLEKEPRIMASFAKPSLSGSISFSKVGMRYVKTSDPTCVGLSFTIDQGMCLAIAGSNGTGKTTLLKLLLGLYKPQAGAISINHQNIRQIDPIYLRQNIAYVPQTPEIFEATIEENIRFAKPEATEEEIWKALELADADKMVRTFPKTLKTTLTTNTEELSSLLKHKIALARFYIRNADILLIDEIPYAILNSKTGKNLIKYIQESRGKRTIIFVTHREDHISIADKALALFNGNRFVFDEPNKVTEKIRDEAFLHHRRIK